MHTSAKHLHALIPTNTIETANRLLDLLQRLHASVEERRLHGIYEVLDQSRTVTLHDPKGRVASVDTTQRVRFRQNHIAGLLDHVWGDGHILQEYRCSPGVPVDRYKEGTRHVVLISLREHKNRGDELIFTTHRQVIGGFTRASECWETEVYNRTRRLGVCILFPRQRRCRRATIVMKSTGQTVALGPSCRRFLPDGRQELVWACNEPKLQDRYLLSWEW
jgi:hypothetical protein